MLLRKTKKSQAVGRRRLNTPPSAKEGKFTYVSIRPTSSNASKSDISISMAPRIKKFTQKRLLIYVGTVVIIGIIIYTLTLGGAPKIVIVGGTNQSIIQPDSVYESAAQKVLSETLLDKFKITINTNKVASQIQDEFPGLSGVSLIIPLIGHEPTLEIRPSQPIFLFTNTQGKYVINQTGVAIASLSQSPKSELSLPVVKDDTGFKVILGQEVLSNTSTTFIKTIIDQFTAKNVSITSMTLSTVPYELDVQVRGEPYYIKFNLLADPVYSAGTYFTVVKLFNSSNPAPSQYIDLRIPGRAYYK